MIKSLFVFILHLASLSTVACTCMDSDDLYDTYRHNKAFVGKVTTIVNYGPYQAYAFLILDALNSGLSHTLTIINENPPAGCQVRFEKDSIYLLDPYKTDRGYNIIACNFIRRQSHSSFAADTALIRQFSKQDTYIHSPYFEGMLKNGKRSGHWIYYSRGNYNGRIYEEGNFVNDKKTGLWKIRGNDELYYSKGKEIWSRELLEDGTLIRANYTKENYTMYYGNGKVYKKLNRHYYTVYHPNGAIKEHTKLTKREFLSGPRIIYNPDGSIQETKSWGTYSKDGEGDNWPATDEFYKYD